MLYLLLLKYALFERVYSNESRELVSTKKIAPAKRRYDGSGRQRDATERQERIIDAAHVRFLSDGYGATSIEQIARDAGTSTQTV